MTMNNTIYAPRTDIALGFQHPFTHPTTTNFIYFKMMQASAPSTIQQESSTESKQFPKIMSKGKEHSQILSSSCSSHDPMQEDSDEDWIDVDEDDNVVSPQHKSYNFYFRFNEDSDDEEEQDESDDDEEHDEEEFEQAEDDIEMPFWYGNEDPKHVEFIMKEYSSFLQLNKDRKPNSRFPVRFIGKIVREALEDTFVTVRDEEDSEEEEDSAHMQRVLITSETIYIYQKSVQSPELCCKFDTSITVQTFYDYEEGTPISILIQPETEWDISSLANVTLLECFPSFGLNPCVFQFGSHHVSAPSEICNLETNLGNAGLFNQCLQNSAGYLAKLKPKQSDQVLDQSESPKTD